MPSPTDAQLEAAMGGGSVSQLRDKLLVASLFAVVIVAVLAGHIHGGY